MTIGDDRVIIEENVYVQTLFGHDDIVKVEKFSGEKPLFFRTHIHWMIRCSLKK